MKAFLQLVAVIIVASSLSGRGWGDLVPMKDGQLVHDTDRQVTWLAHPRLASSETFGLAYINDGRMPYFVALQFIAVMNAQQYLGVWNWRLPRADTDCLIRTNCVSGELGHLFYEELGGLAGVDLYNGGTNTNASLELFGPALIPESGYYWTSTTGTVANAVWGFSFSGGFQDQRHMSFNDHEVWPVFDGAPQSSACWAAKLKAASKFAKSVFKCLAKSSPGDEAVLLACLAKARDQFAAAWEAAEAIAAREQLACGEVPYAVLEELLAGEGEDLAAWILAALDLEDQTQLKLAQALLKATGGALSARLKAESANFKKPDPEKQQALREKIAAKFAVGWMKALSKAEAAGLVYTGPSREAVEEWLNELVDALLNTEPLTVGDPSLS